MFQKTILIYKGEEDINVDNIDKHLSWGRKECICTCTIYVLCNKQKAELIILDDPISSFDSNKNMQL